MSFSEIVNRVEASNVYGVFEEIYTQYHKVKADYDQAKRDFENAKTRYEDCFTDASNLVQLSIKQEVASKGEESYFLRGIIGNQVVAFKIPHNEPDKVIISYDDINIEP